MPSINGKELAAKLRGLDSDLYIAFLSAYKEEFMRSFHLTSKHLSPRIMIKISA